MCQNSNDTPGPEKSSQTVRVLSEKSNDPSFQGFVEIVRTAIRAPNMNAYLERLVESIKGECLNRMIFAGQ